MTANTTQLYATIVDANSQYWWSYYLGVTFLVLSVRQYTVLVKACSDEYAPSPYSVHELPLESVKVWPGNRTPLDAPMSLAFPVCLN